MRFARDISDRVEFMDHGMIVEEGPATAVFATPRSPRLKEFLRSSGV
jgi:ABC-type histidine transport system ATPase subunit